MTNEVHLKLGIKVLLAIRTLNGTNITVKTLAEARGCQQSYISSTLFGKGKCTIKTLTSIADCLGFTVDQIVAFSRVAYWEKALKDISTLDSVSGVELHEIIKGDYV